MKRELSQKRHGTEIIAAAFPSLCSLYCFFKRVQGRILEKVGSTKVIIVILKIEHEAVDLFTTWYAFSCLQIGDLRLYYALCGLFADEELQKALVEAMFYFKCLSQTSVEILSYF